MGLLNRVLGMYSKALKTRKWKPPKTAPVSQELCDAHLVFFPRWKMK